MPGQASEGCESLEGRVSSARYEESREPAGPGGPMDDMVSEPSGGPGRAGQDWADSWGRAEGSKHPGKGCGLSNAAWQCPVCGLMMEVMVTCEEQTHSHSRPAVDRSLQQQGGMVRQGVSGLSWEAVEQWMLTQ